MKALIQLVLKYKQRISSDWLMLQIQARLNQYETTINQINAE